MMLCTNSWYSSTCSGFILLTLIASYINNLVIPFNFLQLAMSARAQFSARDFSDHLAVIRAFDGWIDAERHESGYEYCRRNFLSAQTLITIDSLRNHFLPLLKEIGLVENFESCNTYSHDENLVRAVICAGLFPGICSVVVSKSLYLYFFFQRSRSNFHRMLRL